MSIVVAVKVGDGLVLASDSASTLQTNQGIAKIFNNATKLKQIKNFPIGVGTWGAGSVGQRTLSSLVEEFSNNQEIIETKKLEVKTIVENLKDFLLEKFNSTYKDEKFPTDKIIGVIVGGYSKNNFFPEEYLFYLPEGKCVKLRQSDKNEENFGANWYGLTDAIVRLHYGRDDRLPLILEKHGIEQELIKKIMEEFSTTIQYPVPFGGMSLQDAIDYAVYLVNVVVGRFKFVLGPEVCGGPVDVAVITRDKFEWIKKKEISFI